MMDICIYKNLPAGRCALFISQAHARCCSTYVYLPKCRTDPSPPAAEEEAHHDV